jgi:hypothetical protein
MWIYDDSCGLKAISPIKMENHVKLLDDFTHGKCGLKVTLRCRTPTMKVDRPPMDLTYPTTVVHQ